MNELNINFVRTRITLSRSASRMLTSLTGQSIVSRHGALSSSLYICLVSVARRKTIYEYHRVTLKDEPIKNKTAILFGALPTCNTNTDCQSCVATVDLEYDEDSDSTHSLGCRWCPNLNRCSDGTDRNRQDWLKNKCDSFNVSSVNFCPTDNSAQVSL